MVTRCGCTFFIFLGAATSPAFGQAGMPILAAPPAASTPNNQVLVFVAPGQVSAATGLSKDYGLTYLGTLPDAPDVLRFQSASAQAAATVATQLGTDSRVSQAHQLYDLKIQTMSFVPNDPFYFPGTAPAVGGPGDTSNPNFPGQWHLKNQMPTAIYNDNTIDVRVQGAWNRNLTGSGVVVGIVDDAVQVSHPDLAANNVSSLSRYFDTAGLGTADPSPTTTTSNHGTSVAGVAVARGGNGIGGTGAAPLAGLAGIRTELAGNALLSSYTWSNTQIRIKNHSYGAISPYDAGFSSLSATITTTATSTTAPAIHVFAAGNDRGTTSQDSNLKMLQANPNVITVAALGSNGKFASYSNFGANVFVTAPSNSSGAFAIATTDRTGADGYNTNGTSQYSNLDYTKSFGGTSSAAPLTSGVLALAVQARNDAGFTSDVRVMRHLLARTSRVVDAADSSATSDGGWRTNAAGFAFNQNYGFGLIDANALTQAAVQFTGVTPQVTYNKSTTSVAAAVTDNSATGISRTFTMPTSPGKLEDVQVTLSITHTFRGNLEAYITSPSGYRSRLMMGTTDSADNIDWTFTTNAFWGESVTGNWTITLADIAAGDVGTWNSYSVTYRTGDLVPVPEPAAVLAVAVAALGLGVVGRRRLAPKTAAAAEPAIAS